MEDMLFAITTMEKTDSDPRKLSVTRGNKCIVEFQSFKNNSNEYIVKELVFLDLSTNVVNYFLFKPPYSFQSLNSKFSRSNKWLMNHFHHISWSEGFTDYSEIENIMYHYCQQYREIYTTGEEKCKWVQMFTSAPVNNVILPKNDETNFTNLCVSVKNMQHKTSNCALLRAYRLAYLITSQQLSADSKFYGGGSAEVYKYEQYPQTFHEYYSNLHRSKT